ncbi:MAG TPA: hypothetical protein VGH58_01550 [Solirubrobacterales bacterium]|jgi:hypothetical protein
MNLRLAIQNHKAHGISDEPRKPLGTTETIEDLTGSSITRTRVPRCER